MMAALRFFYTKVLGREFLLTDIPFSREPQVRQQSLNLARQTRKLLILRCKSNDRGQMDSGESLDNVRDKFRVGDRVRVSESYWWAKGALGSISTPPSEVTAISGPWQDNLTRVTNTKLGAKTAYWVWFDEPQRDADDDGPYRGAEIWEEFLTKIAEHNLTR